MSQSCCFHVFSCPGCWHSLSHSLVPHMPKAGQAFGNAPKKSALPGPRFWDRTEGLGHNEETQIIPMSGWVTSDGDKETESRDLALITCLQQGFVRGDKKREPAGSPAQGMSSRWILLECCVKNSRKTPVYFYKPLSANVHWFQEGKDMFKYFTYPGMNCFASLSHN